MRLTPLTVALASLAAAGTAYAQAPATVGAPQTITDPAAQVDAPPAAPAVMTGSVQLHHETVRPDRPSTPHNTSSPPADPPPAPRSVPVAVRTDPARPAPAPEHVAHASARQLPFTGIAAWQIAAAGLALIGIGYGLWRVSPEP